MRRVKCVSGIDGWQSSLRENYATFEDFATYDDVYALAKRLGYKSAECAWNDNPMIEGNINSSDFRRVSSLIYHSCPVCR